MQTLLFALLFATAAADAPASQQLYVLGSSLNLREQPSTEAAVLEKLPIGTPCQVTERPEGTWLKVRCAEKEGYASASLLGPQKPSAEQLKAEALDTRRTLQQREDSALRASTLAPEDTALRELLGKLFFERNFKLVASLRKPVALRTFEYHCFNQTNASCLTDATSSAVKNVRARVETRGALFVAAIGDTDHVTVYRGRYKINTLQELTGEVLEANSFAATPVLSEAIFFNSAPCTFDERYALPLGQYVLDEPSQDIMKALPKQWAVLERDTEANSWWVQWSDCMKRPFLLSFVPDIHGRWRLMLEALDGSNGVKVSRIAAVEKRDGGLELTLDFDKNITHELFKLPQGRDDVAFLGDAAYSFKLNRYSERHHECLEGGP